MNRTLMVFLLWCIASVAQAETVFMMEPQAEERIAEDVRARAMKVTMDSLRSEGFTVLTPEQAKKASASCASEACVRESAQKLHADAGVKISLMATPGADSLGSLGMALYQPDGLVYRAKSVRVLDQGLERAVFDALVSVKERRHRGPGPWLVVTGREVDVELWVDGQRAFAGGLPAELKVSPDHQHVLVAKQGARSSQEYNVPVGPDLASSYEVEVQLEAAPPVAPPPPVVGATERPPVPSPVSDHKVATWKDWTLGGGLVAAGVLVAINPLRTLAQDGDCYKSNCEQHIEFGARSGVLLGLGGVLVAAGVIVPTLWKPFGHLDVVADKQSAMLRFRGTFGGRP